jgi:hypothetical protein
MGDSNHLHHLHAWEVEKLDGHKDVEIHAGETGRYKIAAPKTVEVNEHQASSD